MTRRFCCPAVRRCCTLLLGTVLLGGALRSAPLQGQDLGLAPLPSLVRGTVLGDQAGAQPDKAQPDKAQPDKGGDKGDDDEKHSYGPDPCEARKTLMQWSYGTSFDGGPPSMDEPLNADRPDFTESTKTVGRGVVQLETGYTYTYDKAFGVSERSNSGPDTLLRIGMFAEWFEFRIFDTYINQRFRENNLTQVVNGAEDLQLGFKIALTPQEKLLPETGLLMTMSVPSGTRGVSEGQTLVMLGYLYSWEVVKDRFEIDAESSLNQQVDDVTGRQFWQVDQSISLDFDITKKFGAYAEWYVLVPDGADTVGTQHYLDGGFTYKVTNNLQLDIEAGVGLSRAAEDYFAGSGLSVRF